MKEHNKKRPEEIIIKPSFFNRQNQVDKILLGNIMPDNRRLSLKNDDSKNNSNKNNQKITVTKQIQFCPSSPCYKTETFNSYRTQKKQQNYNNITDNMSERSEYKKLPISREKKIYLYLKNSNKNVDSNLIFENNKTLLKKQEEILNKTNLNETTTKQINEDNFNKTSIINNINNNNVNNIFVNFISATTTNDFSRNLGRDKLNNSFSNSNNNVIDTSIGKATLPKPADSKKSKIIILKGQNSQPKTNNQNHSDKDQKNKLDYYSKIMFTANSFIFNRNNPLQKMKHQQTEPKPIKNHKIKVNNNKDKMSKDRLIKSKKFLKDYMLKNKLKQIKNKKLENLKNHNNSFSCGKIDTKPLGKKNPNQKNPIFINIISNYNTWY